MNNLFFKNLDLNYENLPQYKNIKKKLSNKIILGILVSLKIFWVFVRQLKYDPKGFFKTLLMIKKFENPNKNTLEVDGYDLFKISSKNLKLIKQILLDLNYEYKQNSKIDNVNEFCDTTFKLSENKFNEIKKIMMSDDQFISALKAVSYYKNLKKIPSINHITLQQISASDGYAKKRVLSCEKFPCEYMHRDTVVGQLKILMYLTDVINENNGPTGICKKSHLNGNPSFNCYVGGAIDNLGLFKRDENTKIKFMSLPKIFQIKSDFGSDIPENSQLSDFLLSSEEKILGVAGTIIVFDPLAIHRGGIVREGTRETLQISLSIK